MAALTETPPATASGGALHVPEDGDALVAIDREERWATPAIVTLTWACIIVPSLVQTFTQPKYRVFTGETVEYGTAALVVSLATMMALLGVCGVVILRHLGRLRGDRRGLLVVLLTPWVYQVCRDLYVDMPLRTGGLIYPLVTVALWALRPRLRQLGTVGYLVGLTAVMSFLMGVLLPAKGLLNNTAGDLVTPDKQFLPWGILVGPLSDGNPLAEFLALGVPAMAFVSRRWIRFPLMAITAFCVLWASSRSALMAIGAAALFSLVLTVTPRSARRSVSFSFILAAGSAMVILPAITTDSAAFTNRGYIWTASLQRWKDNPVVGLGSQWYSTSAGYTDNIGSTAFHGHNEVVQLLVLGGVINLLLVGFLFVMMAGNASGWAQRGVRSPAAFMMAFMVSSSLEVSYSLVHRSYLLPVTLLPFAFFAFAQENSAFASDVTPDHAPAAHAPAAHAPAAHAPAATAKPAQRTTSTSPGSVDVPPPTLPIFLPVGRPAPPRASVPESLLTRPIDLSRLPPARPKAVGKDTVDKDTDD